MDPIAFKYLAAGMSVFGMFGSAYSVGNITSSALNAISRNPNSTEKQSVFIFTGLAMAELTGLCAFVLGLLSLF